MATLYVTEPGARIEKEYNRILVTKKDEVLTSVPLALVSEVVLVGWAGATTPAMLALLDKGVGLTMVSRSGRLRGRLRPPEAHNLPLRQRQYEAGKDPELSLRIAKQLVHGKLHNCRTLSHRIKRRTETPSPGLYTQLSRLEDCKNKTPGSISLEQLRGIEGSGARAYFSIFRHGLDWEGESFKKRTRRPPKDPINALLSLGYSLLTNAMVTACEVVGLDPYDGFFHADKYGRPALALDLVEEFRPIIVDSLLLTLINKRILQPRHFFEDGEGVFLNRYGRNKFYPQFVKRLNTKIYHPLAERSLHYQKCFEIQARQIRKVIEGSQPEYQPMKIR